MKTTHVVLLIASYLFSQCTPDQKVNPGIDQKQASIALMNELAPQLTGSWSLSQIRIKHQTSSFHQELGIKSDTVLYNFATLDLAPSTQQRDPAGIRIEGSIHYQSKTYPIRFDLLAGPWIMNQKGPKAYFTVEYNFPVNTAHPTEKEEYLLQQIGLVLETFSLNTTTEKSMTWQGLNRGIERLELVRK